MTLFRGLLLASAVLLVGIGCLVSGRKAGLGGQLLIGTGVVLAGVAVVFAFDDAAN